MSGVFRSWRFIVLCALITIAGAILRIWASVGDLWLDEIWSLDLAARATSPLGIFTEIHHNNNHRLNTIFLYSLGQQPNWVIYRIPAVVAGVFSVLVAGHIGLRRGRIEAIVAMILTAFSYLLIHYSS